MATQTGDSNGPAPRDGSPTDVLSFPELATRIEGAVREHNRRVWEIAAQEDALISWPAGDVTSLVTDRNSRSRGAVARWA